MFTAASFTTAKNWKQPKCPSTNKWIKGMLHSHTIGYYWDININEILIHARTWLYLKKITLSERSQMQKTSGCKIPFIQNVQKRHIVYRDRKQISGCLGLGWKEGLSANRLI